MKLNKKLFKLSKKNINGAREVQERNPVTAETEYNLRKVNSVDTRSRNSGQSRPEDAKRNIDEDGDDDNDADNSLSFM